MDENFELECDEMEINLDEMLKDITPNLVTPHLNEIVGMSRRGSAQSRSSPPRSRGRS